MENKEATSPPNPSMESSSNDFERNWTISNPIFGKIASSNDSVKGNIYNIESLMKIIKSKSKLVID
jgi:hypothetical protein